MAGHILRLFIMPGMVTEKKKAFSHFGKLLLFEMAAAWTYMPIPREKIPAVMPGGWGSIPVVATIGKTTWRTSLFPLKGADYFLPVKKMVLKQENLRVGDVVTVKYSSV